MPGVDRVVARLLERAQEQRREGLAGCRAVSDDRLEQLSLARHPARGIGAVRTLRERRDGQAERRQPVDELQDRLVLGMLVHAVDRRSPGAREHAAHGLVRQQHQLLDE